MSQIGAKITSSQVVSKTQTLGEVEYEKGSPEATGNNDTEKNKQNTKHQVSPK